MIDKLCAVKTSEGARKKRQREINRDETGTRAGSARWRGRRIVREDCSLEASPRAGALWVAGSSGLPVSSSSIRPLCHCQYSKEVQIIWWLMVHSHIHWIYFHRVRSRTDTTSGLFSPWSFESSFVPSTVPSARTSSSLIPLSDLSILLSNLS